MSPTTFTGTNGTYTMVQSLGLPGLYGQAYLCTDSSGTEVVIKMLQPNAPADGPQVLEKEAEILRQVAKAEDAASLHYAVRLLDTGTDSQGNLQFLVLERATGQNVQDDLVDKVVDWQREPLPEATILVIANHFARALQAVHTAGFTYDDMKLQNLFWNGQTLRIIDWNVVSELSGRDKAIAGDWARFGARLYELYTGEAISISRDGLVVGAGPRGSRWEALPAGVQALIRRALDRGYEADAPLLHALDREVQFLALEQAGDWESLLTQAELAEGDANAILAPLSRAERILARSPHLADDPTISKRRNEARTNAEALQGRAPESMIREGFTLLEQRNWPLATEVLQKAYDRSNKRDPRPRRGLWLIALLKDSTDADANEDLRKAVEFLNTGQYGMAQNRMKTVDTIFSNKPLFQGLQIEIAMRSEDAAGNLEVALTQSEALTTLRADWLDLEHYCADLQQRHTTNQERQRLAEADQQASATYQQAIEAARRAEIAEEFAGAIESYHAAIKALQQHSTPDTTNRRWIERHLQHLTMLHDIRRLGAECAQLEPAAIPDVEASFTKRARTLLTPLAPIFTLFEQRGRRFAEEKVATLEHSVTQLKESLEAQRNRYVVEIEIGHIQEQIKAGMLKRAEAEIQRLDEQFSLQTENLLDRQAQNLEIQADILNQREHLLSGRAGLLRASRQIQRQRTQAQTKLGDYRKALQNQEWGKVSDAFQSAIRAEADEAKHYEALGELFPVITEYLNAVVVEPSSKRFQTAPLYDIVASTHPFFQMISSLEDCVSSMPYHDISESRITELCQKYQQRLINIRELLMRIYELSQVNRNDQQRTKDLLAKIQTAFTSLDRADQDALTQIRRLFQIPTNVSPRR